jgi:ABC-2 type transport system permease protein
LLCISPILIATLFGVRIKSGIAGYLLILVISALWAVVFSGFMQLVSMKTRSAAATQGASQVFFPLLFITPNFVPRDMLTRPMQIAASCRTRRCTRRR